MSVRDLLPSGVLVASLIASCGPKETESPAEAVRRISVQASGTAADSLIASGARLIEDYGAFRILAATPEQLANVPAGAPFEVRATDHLIQLNSGPIDTSVAGSQAKALTAAPPGTSLHLVQFIGPPKPDWVERLRGSGVRVVSYAPTNAYLVYGDASAIGRLQEHAVTAPEIQWHGQYLPSHKRPPVTAPTESMYAVQLVEDAGSNNTTIGLARSLSEPLRITRALGYVNVLLRADERAAAALAERPDVVSVLPYDIPRLRDERQDVIIAGQLAGTTLTGPGYLQWLASKGFTQEQFDASGFGVDVSDSGLDNGTTTPNHFGLYVRGDVTGRSRVVYARVEGFPNAASTAAGCDGHGTINAHIVGGYSDQIGAPFLDSAGYRFGLGVAPFVRLGSSVVFDAWNFTFPVFEDLQSRAYADGMRVSSNSWGSNEVHYTSDAQRYDALVRDAAPSESAAPQAGNQQMTIIFSAGNAGWSANQINITSPPNAKNVITVGASENVRLFGGPDQCTVGDDAADSPLDIAFFSSAGPTSDGRNKPDIVAPGTHTTGGVAQSDAQRAATPGDPTGQALTCFIGSGVCGGTSGAFYPPGQQWYTASSGTSHSTPAVAGAAALLRQWFINQGLEPPSPAMTKAYLTNSARYMSGPGDNLPSRLQGMGILDLGAAFDGVSRLLRDQVAEDVFTATGQVRTFQGVADPEKPIRVTLAWTDAPGPTFAAAWVNDLDLSVSVGGVTYLGNVFSGAFSKPGGIPDRKNNLESIFLPPGTGGSFTVTVTAANIAGDSVPGNDAPLDQDFALVVTNACDKTAPPVPAGLAATAGAPNSVSLTWEPSDATEYEIERADTSAGPFTRVASVTAPPYVDSSRSGGVVYWYRVRARSGCAMSAPSSAVSVIASGQCLLAPRFAGLASAGTTGQMTCGNLLSWTPAIASCGGAITYDIHRSTDATFLPSAANRIASTEATSHLDSGDLISDMRYWYIVRAVETITAGRTTDANILARSAAPSWTEVLFEDDFDHHRPADPSGYWHESSVLGPEQLSIVTGCHWQSDSASYKFGAPDQCGGGYLGTIGPDFRGLVRLALGGDGTSHPNGFFIPPDARATLRFHHWYDLHIPADILSSDGVGLDYSTSGLDGGFSPVVNEWETLISGPAPFFAAGFPYGDRMWHWTDRVPNGHLREVVVNADSLANQTVWFSWRFLTSEAEPEEGYFLDDVRLEITRACSSDPLPAGQPASFRIEGLPRTIVAGTDAPFTVTALDASGQPASAFAGEAKVFSNDPRQVPSQSLVFSGGIAQGTAQFRTTGYRALQITDLRGLAHGASVILVSASSPASIRFTSQPRSFKAGSFMCGDVQVVVEDVFGNGVPAAQASLALGNNPGGESWSGPSGVGLDSAGHTSFCIGGICKAARGYTFVATFGPLSATSIPFDVTPNYPAALKFLNLPAVAVACEPIQPAVQVGVVDNCGNVTDDINPISLALDGSIARLRGTTTVRASNGVATFSDLSVDAVGAGNAVVASTLGGVVVGARSASFDVVAGPARRLVVDQQPAGAVAGAPFLQPLAVRIADACGGLITTANRAVVASLSTNVNEGHLSGTTTVDAAGGLARFVDLSLDRAISGYSLRVQASGLADDVSAPFTVTPGPLANLSLSGPASVVSGVSARFTAVALDAQANAIAGHAGIARVMVTDGKAHAPAQIAFNPSGATSFSVVFAAAGTQTVSIADLERPQIRGSVSVEVKARQDGGGCGSAGNTDLSSLLAFALAACWRRSRPSPGLPRMRSNGSLLC